MAGASNSGKLYPLFTVMGASWPDARTTDSGSSEWHLMVVGIAIAMFVALFGWGATYFGWSDPDGKVQLALATSFILGIIGGYRAKG
jgi:hypothetical protein